MLVALPSAIAYGVLVYSAISPDMAGQGAMVGMLGAAALGLVAPIFGGTPALISGPSIPAAALLAGLATQFAAGGIDPGRIAGLIALTALVSALLQVIYGLLRGGNVIKYIPYPVVSGFSSGVGLITALGQFPRLLGVPKGLGVLQGLAAPDLWRWPSILVGAVTIAVTVVAPRTTRRIPAAILGLLAGTLAYLGIGLLVPGLLTVESNPLLIGPIHATGPVFGAAADRLRGLSQVAPADLRLVFYPALALSALLAIDTLKTCVVLDAMTRRRHNSNRELFGQGIGNLAAFAIGGMSGSGQTGPTLLNAASGGRTRYSGVAEGVFVVLAILVLAPLIAWVPIGALAGILLVVAYRMCDWSALRLLTHADTRLEFAVIASVVLVAQQSGLIQACGVGVGLAILLFIRDQMRNPVLRRRASLKEISSKTSRLEAEREVLAGHGDMAGLYELQGNLFFGTAEQLSAEIESDLTARRWLLFDMRRVQSMDTTAAQMFQQLQARMQANGGGLLFCGMPSILPTGRDIGRYLDSVGLVDGTGRGIRVFETRDEGLEWMENRVLESVGWTDADDQAPIELGEVELLRDADAQMVDELSRCAHVRHVRAGAKVFSLGDEGDEMFLVRRGVVRVLLPLKGGKRHHLATFSRGDFFGEMSFLDRGKRSADAEAKTDCELYVLSRGEFNARARANPVLGVRTFARLARAVSLRLRQTDGELRALEER